MDKLVAQHGIIGKLISEIETEAGILSIVNLGNRVVAVNGKTWDASKLDLRTAIGYEFQELIDKYKYLGATERDFESVLSVLLGGLDK